MSGRLIATYATGFALPTPPLKRPMHRHVHHEIIHNLKGIGVSTTADGQELDFGPGDTCIYPAHLRHDRRYETAGAALVIRLGVAHPLPPALRRARLVRGPHPPWALAELRALAGPQAALDGLARQALDHRACALLCALLAEAGPDLPPDPEAALAERADRMIAERFASIGRLASLASALGVGYDRLRRIYRRQRGQSLVARLTAARVERAQELLANSTLDQAEIARQCGYANARYLNRVFRRTAGTAPGHWRR